MEKITKFQVKEKDGSLVDCVKIDKGNDEAIWLIQAEYDRQQAEQSTPMIPADE